jgi:hypothetical protein
MFYGHTRQRLTNVTFFKGRHSSIEGYEYPYVVFARSLRTTKSERGYNCRKVRSLDGYIQHTTVHE